MLATLIPLFNENMMVKGYSVFAEKQNAFMHPMRGGVGRFDGAGFIIGFDLVESMGIKLLADDNEVFIEVDEISIFSDIASQCTAPRDKIVLLLGPGVKPNERYLIRVAELKKLGFKLAFRKLPLSEFENYRPILQLMDYFLINHKSVDMNKVKVYFEQRYPNTKLCAVNVTSQEEFETLKKDGKYHYFEGPFFRMPIVDSQIEVAPLKVNYINLLNIVNDDDFDLTKAADVIGQDAALVISLLSIVNKMTMNSDVKSVRHAAAMLGQKDLKKWINTAVTKALCADKPSEITRICMIRAKFAENLAPLFDLGGLAQELFLMGMFSVLDIMIDKPMEEALAMVHVSKNVQNALVSKSGDLMPIYDFILNHEDASWQEVSRIMVLYSIETDDVYNAYTDALKWYRDLVTA